MQNEKQIIITIAREYGSGGYLIADMLGKNTGCRCTTAPSSRSLGKGAGSFQAEAF